MPSTQLWQTIVGCGRAGIEALSNSWMRVTPADIARDRLRADTAPRSAACDFRDHGPPPQKEATQRILYGNLMALKSGTEIKYRVLTIGGNDYAYLPSLFDTDGEADAAGRSWCKAWDEEHKEGPRAGYDVEPVWQRKVQPDFSRNLQF